MKANGGRQYNTPPCSPPPWLLMKMVGESHNKMQGSPWDLTTQEDGNTQVNK